MRTNYRAAGYVVSICLYTIRWSGFFTCDDALLRLLSKRHLLGPDPCRNRHKQRRGRRKNPRKREVRRLYEVRFRRRDDRGKEEQHNRITHQAVIFVQLLAVFGFAEDDSREKVLHDAKQQLQLQDEIGYGA